MRQNYRNILLRRMSRRQRYGYWVTSLYEWFHLKNISRLWRDSQGLSFKDKDFNLLRDCQLSVFNFQFKFIISNFNQKLTVDN